MRRTGVAPQALTFFFTIASRLEATPDHFEGQLHNFQHWGRGRGQSTGDVKGSVDGSIGEQPSDRALTHSILRRSRAQLVRTRSQQEGPLQPDAP